MSRTANPDSLRQRIFAYIDARLEGGRPFPTQVDILRDVPGATPTASRNVRWEKRLSMGMLGRETR